jgi:tetratricopeptide (TPR) repeat protein
MMKIKTLVAVLLLSAGATSALAQSIDSLCNVNSSISHEAVKAGNFKDAYLPWKKVMKDCPLLRYYTYSDGFDILKYFLTTTKGKPEYNQYFDELMATYDQLIKNTPELQANIRGVRSAEKTLALKAIDYMQFAPKPDVNLAYEWLNKSVNAEKSESLGAVLFYFLDSSLKKLQLNPDHKEQFIQDYLNDSQWADDAIAAATKENVKKDYQSVKDNLVALFINSGTASCESLQEIYAPKIEANKTNLVYLKKVLDIMRMMKCTEQEAYFKASFYSYKIEPTSDAAAGCAYMSFKKGDIDDAIKFFDQAIQLESDNSKKAEFSYAAATVLASVKRLSPARNYAQKAISFKENYGAPYILIANLYATSPNWSDEPALNKCTYYVILDKLARAKAVDPSCAADADKLIATYRRHTPAANELFMLGHKQGDRITIGGWIGETTTIR